uniref:Uncharacterized protein n=1 Tax=Rhizophora mucronata TaxID=61149 RepID=A0A2P2PJ65_RHIMU
MTQTASILLRFGHFHSLTTELGKIERILL